MKEFEINKDNTISMIAEGTRPHNTDDYKTCVGDRVILHIGEHQIEADCVSEKSGIFKGVVYSLGNTLDAEVEGITIESEIEFRHENVFHLVKEAMS